MIKIKTYSKTTNSLSNINLTDSILIIGRGGNERKLNEIYKPKGTADMFNIFGECDLYYSYVDAVNLGASNIFIINAYKTTDFIDCVKNIKFYNFSYIVPIGINISDKFYSNEYNKEMYYAEYYISEFSENTNSQIIFTDEHAEFYENITHFMDDMNNKIFKFKESTSYLMELFGSNLLFSLNSLVSIKYSNVALASILSNTIPGNYPNEINAKSVFDLNYNDILENEIIYFKNNYIVNTSIENLNNFRTTYDANKLVVINSVIKYIEKTIDLSNIIGKYYNEYLKIYISDNLNKTLKKMINVNIKDYSIDNITFIKNKSKMTGYFLIDMSIYPINSLENLSITLEVR